MAQNEMVRITFSNEKGEVYDTLDIPRDDIKESRNLRHHWSINIIELLERTCKWADSRNAS